MSHALPYLILGTLITFAGVMVLQVNIILGIRGLQQNHMEDMRMIHDLLRRTEMPPTAPRVTVYRNNGRELKEWAE